MEAATQAADRYTTRNRSALLKVQKFSRTVWRFGTPIRKQHQGLEGILPRQRLDSRFGMDTVIENINSSYGQRRIIKRVVRGLHTLVISGVKARERVWRCTERDQRIGPQLTLRKT